MELKPETEEVDFSGQLGLNRTTVELKPHRQSQVKLNLAFTAPEHTGPPYERLIELEPYWKSCTL